MFLHLRPGYRKILATAGSRIGSAMLVIGISPEIDTGEHLFPYGPATTWKRQVFLDSAVA